MLHHFVGDVGFIRSVDNRRDQDDAVVARPAIEAIFSWMDRMAANEMRFKKISQLLQESLAAPELGASDPFRGEFPGA
ncbi:hypothetical protein [Bradyrhizobium sp. ARR65]|uniref:hypothetical protein n=1 Tax=Bradyrhizobium sp. ARR65 TaxID=1040989 RepID=UPI0009FBF2F1|nr:hypothetical protein [Bradyrhizobium sp. ARR65]